MWISLAAAALGLHLCAPCWRGLLPRDPVPGEATVRVITFNAQGCRGGADRIATLLRKEKPDVVAFEEASFFGDGGPEAETITNALPNYHWFREANLAIASRWPIARSWVSDFKTPTHTWAIFAEIHVEGQPERPLLVGAVHLNPVQWDRFVSAEIGKLPDHLRNAGRVLSNTGSDHRPLLVEITQRNGQPRL